ncbi:MAG: ATP-binding protein [Bacteroidota bacterium]
MMNDKIAYVKRLVRTGENQFIEFKKKVNHPEKIVREVCAFANSEGGHLLIGVDDNGTISGLKYPEDEEFEMTKAINELCRPTVDFSVEILKIKEDVEILHYQIKEGSSKPHFAFLEKHHRRGRCYVRVDDHSIQASYELRQILKNTGRESTPIPYEESTRELFKHLEEHDNITLSQYLILTGWDQKRASAKLIELTLSGLLRIVAKEGGDLFVPAK